MENLQRGDWNNARTALTPAEWLEYAEDKPGNFQVLAADLPLFRHPVSYQIALGAFAYYAPRSENLRLVDESEYIRITGATP